MKFSQFSDFRGLLFAPLLSLVWHQPLFQQKPEAKPTKSPVSAQAMQSGVTERKNPIPPTPENLAEAKKFFAYDCAMCHDATGDGKGDLVASMGLKMKDWREPNALAAMSDGEIFEIIAKGKGKMAGEGDRAPTELVWKLVNYVRYISSAENVTAPKSGASQ